MEELRGYIRWTENEDFSFRPFSAVDNEVLCKIAYLNMSGVLTDPGMRMTLRDICGAIKASGRPYEFMSVNISDERNDSFIEAAASSKRFGDMYLTNYVDEYDDERIQFSAVTFEIDDTTRFIAYRGTDESLIGWREDFMLSYTKVPAQQSAVDYANRYITDGYRYYMGGHSKGGNLVTYAAAYMDETSFDRNVIRVFINDGPGLSADVFDIGKVQRIADRAIRIMPEYDVIGMLFEQTDIQKMIVKSSLEGFEEHEGSSWLCDADGFVTVEKHSADSLFINRIMNVWLETASMEEREVFVNDLFAALSSDGSTSFGDILSKGPKAFYNILVELTASRPETYKMAASVPLSVIMDDAEDVVKTQGAISFIHTHPALMGILFIIAGMSLLFIARHSFEVVAAVIFVIVVAVQIISVIVTLIKTHFDLDGVEHRIQILIGSVILCANLIFKEHALFVITSFLSAMILLVLAFNRSKYIKGKRYTGIVKMMTWCEMVICALLGFVSLFAPYSITVPFTMTVGSFVIIDGIMRLIFAGDIRKQDDAIYAAERKENA